MSSNPVFLVVSANPSADQQDLAKSLNKECEMIRKLLDARFINKLEVKVYLNSSTDDFRSKLQNRDFRNRIIGIHYAGHGEQGDLLLTDPEGKEIRAHREGLVRLLRRLPNLYFVFLNCCTGEVLAQSILGENRLVIASPFLVPTESATAMAKGFYEALTKHKESLEESYTQGIDTVLFDKGAPRGLAPPNSMPLPSAENTPQEWEKVWRMYSDDQAFKEVNLVDLLDMFEWNMEYENDPPEISDPIASTQKLLDTRLEIDFDSQEGAIRQLQDLDPGQVAKGFLFHGSEAYGIPLLRYRVLRHLIRDKTSLVIDFQRLGSAVKAEELWGELGMRLDVASPVTEAAVIQALANRLSQHIGDFILRIDNALYINDEHLHQVLEQFWLRLARGVQAWWNEKPNPPAGRLVGLFFAEYTNPEAEEAQLAQIKSLAANHAAWLTVLESTRAFKSEEIELFLHRHGNEFLLEEHRAGAPESGADTYNELSKAIFYQTRKGTPQKVMELLCEWGGGDFNTFQTAILNLEK